MDVRKAERLINSLCVHANWPVDENSVLESLKKVPDKETSRFHDRIHSPAQLIQEGVQRYHHFSLKRILRNELVKKYHLSPFKKKAEAIGSFLGVYSSTALSRDIRANSGLIELMDECDCSFSLLGKLRTYAFDNPYEQLFIQETPVLVIPGSENNPVVRNWERENTVYKKEVAVFPFVNYSRRISEEQFCADQIALQRLADS